MLATGKERGEGGTNRKEGGDGFPVSILPIPSLTKRARRKVEQKWQPRKTGGLFPEKVSSFSSSVDSVRSKNLEEANDATRSNIPCKGGRKKKKEKRKEERKERVLKKKKKERKDEKDEQCSP